MSQSGQINRLSKSSRPFIRCLSNTSQDIKGSVIFNIGAPNHTQILFNTPCGLIRGQGRFKGLPKVRNVVLQKLDYSYLSKNGLHLNRLRLE